MSMVGNIETISRYAVNARKRCIEFRYDSVWWIALKTLDEAVFVAVPFAGKTDRIVELGRLGLGQEAGFENVGNELLASDRDKSLFVFRHRSHRSLGPIGTTLPAHRPYT